MGATLAAWAVLVSVGAAAGPALLESTAGWSNSTRPSCAPPRAPGGLVAVFAEDGRPVLRAAFGFGDPRASEPVFITRRLDPPIPRRPIRRVRFRYRFTVVSPEGASAAPLAVPGGFLVRLRTSPTEHTNYEVPPVEGRYPAGVWVQADLPVDLLGPRVRNVYQSLFSPLAVTELTFRLDDVDDTNACGYLDVADLSLEMAPEPGADVSYTPTASARSAAEHLRLFAVPHGADGWYDFGPAARRVDPGAEVLESPFRGLHFPIWGFPGTRDGLLAFDVVALGDVDPWVLTVDQSHWLADAVHSGVGLLVCGGPWSLGQARSNPAAFRDLLPVTWDPGAKPVAVNSLASATADHELLAGVDPSRLGTVRSVCPVKVRETGATTLLAAGGRPLLVAGEAGRGRVLVLTTWAQPARLGDGSFMTTPAWGPFAARLLAWLSGRPLPAMEAPAPAEAPFALSWRYAKSALAPGVPFGLEVKRDPLPAAGIRVTAELVADGETVWERVRTADTPSFTIDGVLPELASGPVTARVRFADGAEARVTGTVVDPLRRQDFFPLITYLPTSDGGHWGDPEFVERLVEEVHRQGFNTIAQGGFGGNAGGGIGPALRGLSEEYAGARGMASILEYTTFTFLRQNRPHEVSPFDPAFPARMAERYGQALEETRYCARLLSVKFRDEPTVGPRNLDAGEATRAAFRERCGRDLPDRQALGDSAAERCAYGLFLSEYLERDFAAARAARDAAGVRWDLLQTYMRSGYGAGRPLDDLEDAYRWSRPADRFDFDVYPYFYPASDRLRFVQATWCFAASRVMARALGKPWGFYVELDDRNWPYQQNPAEASAECAHTAVAAGAEYLNTFIFRTCTTGSGARPERWARTGEAFRVLRRLGPLLARTRRVPARVAVLFPESHWFARNGYSLPQYTLALLAQAAGDADVIHEELVAEGREMPSDALVLCGADVLRRDAFDQLAAWVRKGGMAVLDHLPPADEQDRRLPWPKSFAEGAGRIPDGAGEWVLVPGGLEQRCREAVENGDDNRWQAQIAALRKALAPRLRDAGPPRAEVLSGGLRGEAGLRTGPDTVLAVIVNHDPAPQTMGVRLYSLPFRPGFVQDAVSFERLDAAPGARGDLMVSGVVPGRGARYVVAYPSGPAALSLRVAVPAAPRGGTLEYEVDLGVPGVWLVDLTVSDPAGVVHERLGGSRATEGGRCTVRETIPVNARRGLWRVAARAPQAGVEAQAAFRVD